MDLEQRTSSVGGEVTIKQEPVEAEAHMIPKPEVEYITVEADPLVEAEAHLSLKQEIEYISVKEEPPCLQKWEVLDNHGSSQDPLSITTEEYSPPEDYLRPSTSSINKTEVEEGEGEDADEDDWEEIKHEVEPTSDGSEPESAILPGDGDNKSIDDSDDLITIQETSSDNECGVSRQWYWCSICKKTFAQFQDLREHRQVSGHEALHSSSISFRTSTSNKELMADSHLHANEHPRKKFTEGSVLKQLLQRHASEPQNRCNVCHKKFKFKSHLKQHLRRTTSNCFMKCYVCGKIFKNSCAIETHLKVHTFGGPYSCDICKKTFKRKVNLKQHSQKHIEVRPFGCVVCNRKFTSSHGLKIHSHVHTGNERS